MAADGGERGKMGGLRNKEDLAYAALMVCVRALMLFCLRWGVSSLQKITSCGEQRMQMEAGRAARSAEAVQVRGMD